MCERSLIGGKAHKCKACKNQTVQIQINFGSQDASLIQTMAQSASATFSEVAPSTECAVYNHLLTFGESL